jgi:hypothetical protein
MLRKLVLICMATVAWVAAFAEDAGQSTQTLPTVQEIVERNVRARGGLDAWRTIRSMSMGGEMDAGHGMKLPYTLDLQRQHRSRLELHFQGKTAVQVFDGKQGWKVRPYLGVRKIEDYTANELRSAAAEAELDGMLIDYQAKGYSLELSGRDQVQGRDAYKIKVTMPGNIVRYLWLDLQTFLEMKIDGTRRMDGRDRAMETFIRDYRLESGLLMPHTFETAVQGVKEHQTLVVQSIVLNPQFDTKRFAKPE